MFTKTIFLLACLTGLATAENSCNEDRFYIPNGNPPGTTLQVINEKDEYKQTIITVADQKWETMFVFKTKLGDTVHRTHIVTEEFGFRIYYNGEDFAFFEANITAAMAYKVCGGENVRNSITQEAPVWTKERNTPNIQTYNYNPEGIEINAGKYYNLTAVNSYKIQEEDYFVITGNRTYEHGQDMVMQIGVSGNANDRTGIKLYWNPIKDNLPSPSLVINTVDKDGNDYDKENYYRDISFNGRFTVAIVREAKGWRIFYNGEDFAFYKDRVTAAADVFNFLSLQKIRHSGTLFVDWSVMKITWKHT